MKNYLLVILNKMCVFFWEESGFYEFLLEMKENIMYIHSNFFFSCLYILILL